MFLLAAALNYLSLWTSNFCAWPLVRRQLLFLIYQSLVVHGFAPVQNPMAVLPLEIIAVSLNITHIHSYVDAARGFDNAHSVCIRGW